MNLKNKKLDVRWDPEYCCYDVEIWDQEATVSDLEKACTEVFEKDDCKRQYSKECIGCSTCCTGRIPITLVDVLRMKKSNLEPEQELNDWIGQNAKVSRDGECVDITLSVDGKELCNFWNGENGRCQIYPYRTFACRTYICAPLSHRLEQLRAEVINQGEDELVRLAVAKQGSIYCKKNQFADKSSYDEVLLISVCSRKLWHYLNRHD